MSKATWKDVLLIVSEMPEPIRVSEVAKKYDKTLGEISGRLSLLQRWGYIKYADRQLKGYGGYIMTEWGKTCSKKWREEQKELSSTPIN